MQPISEGRLPVIAWLAEILFGDPGGHGRDVLKAEKKVDFEAWLERGRRIKASDRVLEELLRARDGRVNLPQVAYALGRLGRMESVLVLIDALRSDSSLLRIEAASSLGLLGNQKAVEALCDRLADDTDDNVRANACVALGKIGDLRAKPFLERAAKDKSKFVASLANEALKLLEK